MAEEQFGTILTTIGKAKIANAALLGNRLVLKTLKIGDSNGQYYEPIESQTELKHEVYSCDIGSIKIDDRNPNWVKVETILSSSVGGFTIREVGICDADGDLIAISKYPETYKPIIENGAGKDICIRLILEVSNAEQITLNLDPSVIIATKEDVDNLQKQINNNTSQLNENTQNINNLKTNFENANLHEINDCHSMGLEIGKQYLAKETALNRPSNDSLWYTIEIKKAYDDNFMVLAYPINNNSVNYYFCTYTPAGWTNWKETANTKTINFSASNLLNGWKIRGDADVFNPTLSISGNIANLSLQLEVQNSTIATNGTVPFNIPDSYRPSHTVEIVGNTISGKFLTYDVTANGDLRIWIATQQTTLSIGDIIPISITYPIK